jgi:hypothetical protein
MANIAPYDFNKVLQALNADPSHQSLQAMRDLYQSQGAEDAVNPFAWIPQRIDGFGNILKDASGNYSVLQDGLQDGGAYYSWSPDENGKWSGTSHTYHQDDSGFMGAIGKITPVVATALMAFISGGAAAGAMGGGAGAGAGVGATEGGGGMAGAGTASGGLGETAEGFSSLPAGGMGATGELGSLGAGGTAGADYGALGSGMYGTGDTAMSGTLGTSGGAMPLGSGMSGVTSSDLSAAGIGSGFDWTSQAQKIAKSLLNEQQSGGGAGSGQVGGGGLGGSGLSGGGQSPMLQNNYQSPNLMPTFSTAPAPVSNDELQNSANIRLLAQRLRGNNGF